MFELTYIMFLAINNRFIRGLSYVDKEDSTGNRRKFRNFSAREKIIYVFTNGISSAIYAGIASALLSGNYIIGIICTVGLWIWDVIGWGKGFSAFHGRYSLKEKEFLPADIIGNWIYRKTGKGRLAGSVWFSIRGLMIVFLFAALAYYLTNPLAYYLGVVCGISHGITYGIMRFVPEKYASTGAELLTGATIGGMIACVI